MQKRPTPSGGANGETPTIAKASASQSTTASTAATKADGRTDHPDVDRIVLQYLKTKGYTKAATSLQSEASVQTLTQLSDQFQPHQDVSLPNYILFYNEAEQGNPDAYQESYSLLRQWVDRSLDLYQPEFLTVSYPVFVHAYLDLVTKELKDHAQRFWDLFSSDHQWRHPQDVQRLALVQEPSHTQDNPLAQRFLQSKYNVRMSKVAFELLMSFLQENKCMLLLRIINQFVNISVQETPVGTQGDMGLVGASSAELEQIRQAPLTLGRFPISSALQTDVEQSLKELIPQDAMDVDGSAGDLMRELAKIKKEPGTDAPAPLDVPYPPHKAADVQVMVQELKDIRKRVALSQEALPSICCYTFHNTYDRLNCTDVAQDLSLLVGGFAESYIKVWSLTEEPLRGLRSNFNPGHITTMDDLNRFRERSDSPYKKLVGHSGPVFGVKLSQDARYLVSCSEDKTARLWSMDTLTNLVCYRGHNYPIWDVDFGPFGYYFATASHDKTARLWSCEHISPLRIFAGHLSDVECVKFHPNSKYVVTGSSDKTCRLWDVQRGTCVRVFTGHTAPITAVAIAPNGRTMASASGDKTITLWDLGSGQCMSQLTGHEQAIYSLVFSQESTLLMSGGADCTVRVWNTTTGQSQTAPTAPATALLRTGACPSTAPNASTAASATLGSLGGKMNPPGTSKALAVPVVPCDQLLATFPTKRTPVYQVHCTKRNLGIAVGAFQF
ncbi:Transcription initiation factor TFIID subunit 5 [Dimargaris xerosporica]|nr:Transcription initiation factor TFIID subunit 5 [Dimargaris xerosporica]